MAHRKTSKRSKARTMLRLADLEQSKNAVLHSPAAATRIFSQFDELRFWILIVQGADSGVECDLSDGASRFLSEMGAKLMSSHCCLLYRRLRSAP